MNFLKDIKKLFSGKQSWLFLAVIIVLALGIGHYSSNKGLLGENMSSQRLLSQNDPNVTGEKLAAAQAGNVQPSAPLGGNGGFAQVSGMNSGVSSGMPSSCSPQSMPDPAALLPKDNNSAWAKLNPSGQGNLDSPFSIFQEISSREFVDCKILLFVNLPVCLSAMFTLTIGNSGAS